MRRLIPSIRSLTAGSAEIVANSFRRKFCFVIHSQGQVGIIDTGGGTSMGDQCGHLPALLQTAGIVPADIDTVMLTHMHPDHSNGLTSVD
jgi:glyoxylase-like metal-dependent hydrolase (beta-lactamase superfamily II)